MEYELTYKKFRELVKEGKLPALKCRQCGEYIAPPRGICPECSSDNLEIISLSGKGEIQTFSIISVPPEGFEGPIPVAMVKLSEGPWVIGKIEGIDPHNTGMEVIGRKVTLGYKEVPGDKISPVDRLALVFHLVEE